LFVFFKQSNAGGGWQLYKKLWWGKS